MNIEQLKNEMLVQDKRHTAWPIFVVVEDQKIYHVSDDSDGKERKDADLIDLESDVCEECYAHHSEHGELPDECDNWECDGSFVTYRIEKDVPNMRAGFFFTADACNEHIKNQRHHYNATAKSYAISAYHNHHLREVMEYLVGEENADKLQ